ncbi:MAG: acyl-CoA thioesterase [Candidatus Omnitrophota bacterium]|jgi:acyl-CoA thioester hydrolase
MRRKKGNYFAPIPGAPAPVTVSLQRRVSFSEVDPMGIVWHGRYPQYFEEGFAALGRMCGFSYQDFYRAGLRAPIVQMHIDYFAPLVLDEEVIIEAGLLWSEGARIHIEYALYKENGTLAAAGYTVQMFTDAVRGVPLLVSPPLIEECRRRWKKGDLQCAKKRR